METICNTLNIISRDAVKDLFMVAYFDNKSIASMGNHTCHSMLNISHQQRKEVYHEMELLQQATRYVLGDTNYGSEIFYHESCIYLDVLEELLKRGYFVWQVYDAWYARKAGVTQNAFELEVK